MSQSGRPQRVSENIWYYEEGRKLTFVVESARLEQGGPHGTIQFHVPLSMLEKSLARSPKKKSRKVRRYA